MSLRNQVLQKGAEYIQAFYLRPDMWAGKVVNGAARGGLQGTKPLHVVVCEGPKRCCVDLLKVWLVWNVQFEKWFKDLLLPILKHKVGKKLIIGDNLIIWLPTSLRL